MDRTLTESVFDKSALMERFGADRQRAWETIKAVLDDLPELLAKVRRARQDGDESAFARATCGLKEAIGSVFARSAYEIAQQLEANGLGANPLTVEQGIQSLEAELRLLARHLLGLRDELTGGNAPRPRPR